MAGDVLNVKDFNTLKQRSDFKGKYHTICPYSYNLRLPAIPAKHQIDKQ